MSYIKIANGQPEIYSIGQLRRDNPNTSFPKSPSDALLADWGVYPYTVQDQPDIDDRTQTQRRAALPTQSADGAWVLGWVVTDKSSEEIEAYDDAKRQGVRSHRDSLLSQTDWMALSDVTMTPEWAVYRQALRDVTAQEGFPYAVIWPVKPE